MAKSKQSAPESQYIRRGRKKLLEKLNKEKDLITEEALKKQVERIQASISRTLPYRISIKRKRIHLFDENTHSKKASRKIDEIISRIKERYQL